MERLLYLSREEIQGLGVGVEDYLAAVEEGLLLKEQGRVDMPPKTEILPQGQDFLHAMPCAIQGGDYCGMKWISGYYGNPSANGLPALMGLILLNDAATGAPVAVMDCMEITKMRTAAVSGVALRHLANPDSKTACVLGCGEQGEANLEVLFHTLPEVEEVRLYNPSLPKAQALQAKAQRAWGREVSIAAGVRQAVEGCQVVLVAAPGRRDDSIREIRADWILPGATVVTVNNDSSFVRGEIRRCADKVYVDDLEMYRWCRREGLFDGIDQPPLELGTMLAGRDPGRQSSQQTIFSMPIGIGVDDLMCAVLYYRRALEQGRGTWLPL